MFNELEKNDQMGSYIKSMRKGASKPNLQVDKPTRMLRGVIWLADMWEGWSDQRNA